MTRRLALLGATTVAAVVFALAACTSTPPRQPTGGKNHPAARPATSAGGPEASALARAGWLIPATYQRACASESSVCLASGGSAGNAGSLPAGRIPDVLRRPLHFPVLRPGQQCPATRGSPVNTPFFGGTALGNGPVRPIIAAQEPAGDLRRGIANLLTRTSAPPWLGFKTLWFSFPAYQGPFVIRAKRLDHRGVIAMGEGPVVAPLVVPPGPTLNAGSGWREAPGGTWVKAPGCYAWQVDGLTFSEIIVVRAVLP